MKLILQAIKVLLRRIESRIDAKIDSLRGSVETAQTTADTAVESATNAQITADTAVVNASTAQNAADNAMSQAISAQEIAEEAKATAEETATGKFLPLTGGTMSGNITMNGYKVTGLAAPSALADAVTKKYVDNKRLMYTATLTIGNWGGTGPYTQKIIVSGLRDSDRPHVGPVCSGDVEQDIAMKTEATKIDYAKAETNAIVFTCLREKPVVDISIQMEVLR